MVPVQPFQQFNDPLGGSLVQVARWLVRQQHCRLIGQRPSQSHPLLLASRKLAHASRRSIRQPDFTQQFSRSRPWLMKSRAR